MLFNLKIKEHSIFDYLKTEVNILLSIKFLFISCYKGSIQFHRYQDKGNILVLWLSCCTCSAPLPHSSLPPSSGKADSSSPTWCDERASSRLFDLRLHWKVKRQYFNTLKSIWYFVKFQYSWWSGCNEWVLGAYADFEARPTFWPRSI